MNQIPMYHPELDVTVYVPESAVPIHKASGWVLADGEPPAEPVEVASVPPRVSTADEQSTTEPADQAASSTARGRARGQKES